MYFIFSALFEYLDPPALWTGDLYIGEKLYVQADHAGAVADRTAQFPCIVGKVSRLIAQFFCVCGAGKCLAQFIVDVGVGGYGGADIDADGRGVDQFHMRDPVCADGAYMIRQRFPR